jgi:hypothetical protein
VICHPAFPVEPWCLRATYLDLDVLAQSESLFALSNGHLGWRGTLDEGETSEGRPTWCSPCSCAATPSPTRRSGATSTTTRPSPSATPPSRRPPRPSSPPRSATWASPTTTSARPRWSTCTTCRTTPATGCTRRIVDRAGRRVRRHARRRHHGLLHPTAAPGHHPAGLLRHNRRALPRPRRHPRYTQRSGQPLTILDHGSPVTVESGSRSTDHRPQPAPWRHRTNRPVGRPSPVALRRTPGVHPSAVHRVGPRAAPDHKAATRPRPSSHKRGSRGHRSPDECPSCPRDVEHLAGDRTDHRGLGTPLHAPFRTSRPGPHGKDPTASDFHRRCCPVQHCPATTSATPGFVLRPEWTGRGPASREPHPHRPPVTSSVPCAGDLRPGTPPPGTA